VSSWGIGELTWLVARSCHATMDVRMARTGRPKAALVLTKKNVRPWQAGRAGRPAPRAWRCSGSLLTEDEARTAASLAFSRFHAV